MYTQLSKEDIFTHKLSRRTMLSSLVSIAVGGSIVSLNATNAQAASVPWTAGSRVVAWGPDRLDIFGLGTNNSMYHKAWTGSSWYPSPTDWESIGGVFNSPPSAVSWGSDRLDIFGLGTNNSMFHKAWTGSSWFPSPTGWEGIGGVFNSPPSAVSWGPNRLDIFGLGTNNSMFHKAWTGSSLVPLTNRLGEHRRRLQ